MGERAKMLAEQEALQKEINEETERLHADMQMQKSINDDQSAKQQALVDHQIAQLDVQWKQLSTYWKAQLEREQQRHDEMDRERAKLAAEREALQKDKEKVVS